ncbi:MAG TPA: OsmC family peroxiredoxin [Thermofilum sp.]|nr:OsmC family peroxiredoxin [Thermofilum sp.]
MKSKAMLVEGFWIAVDNGRSHSITLDLPKDLGGSDKGPTALELTVMGLAGCIATIFRLMSTKLKFPLKGLVVEVEAEKPSDEKTITTARVNAVIRTEADEKLVERAWKLTLENCPVGLLFEKAGVKMEFNYKVEKE